MPASSPLFSVRSATGFKPITLAQFSAFISRVTKAQGLDASKFSAHSFRRGGASFAFEAGVPAELIKVQGDWQSDAYLVYLEMTDTQKQAAVTRMASRLVHS